MVRTNAFVMFLIAAAGCAAGCQGPAHEGSAQGIVDSIAKKHPGVVRLTLHALPKGESDLRVVASTAPEKRNKPSDPEDHKAMQNGEEVVLPEGENLDVTIPLPDASGNRMAVAGVTLAAAGKSRDELVAQARAVAGELGAALRAAGKPLW